MDAAEILVTARRTGRRLSAFPGPLPIDLDQAYALQDRCIALSDRPVGGWKVAAMSPSDSRRFGATRLVGPIFADLMRTVRADEPTDIAVFHGGFAALEAEFAVVLARDLDGRKMAFTVDAVRAAIAALHVGIEIASSPLEDLPRLGPTAIIADHGNNAGALIGPSVRDWQRQSPRDLASRFIIDGELVGQGSAASVPGGPFAAVADLAGALAQRGRFLRAGDVVLTGNTTGVHEVRAGSYATAEFPGTAALHMRIGAYEARNESSAPITG